MIDDPRPGDPVVFTLAQVLEPDGLRAALRFSHTYTVSIQDESGKRYLVSPVHETPLAPKG